MREHIYDGSHHAERSHLLLIKTALAGLASIGEYKIEQYHESLKRMQDDAYSASIDLDQFLWERLCHHCDGSVEDIERISTQAMGACDVSLLCYERITESVVSTCDSLHHHIDDNDRDRIAECIRDSWLSYCGDDQRNTVIGSIEEFRGRAEQMAKLCVTSSQKSDATDKVRLEIQTIAGHMLTADAIDAIVDAAVEGASSS